MIFVLTVYWNSSFWAPIQLRYLASFSKGPIAVLAFKDERTQVESIETSHVKYRILGDGGVRSHAEKLNILANIACSEAEDSDILMFLDADAFPIAEYEDFIHRKLDEYDLVAVRRDEEQEPQPHPCFCAVKVKTWREINGDWRRGPVWIDNDGYKITDVGATLHQQLKDNGKNWYPLLRSNHIDLHPTFFAMYGGMIYHHGAGTRQLVSRQDVKRLNRSLWFRVLPGVIRVQISKFYRARIAKRNCNVDEHVRGHLDDVAALKKLFM